MKSVGYRHGWGLVLVLALGCSGAETSEGAPVEGPAWEGSSSTSTGISSGTTGGTPKLDVGAGASDGASTGPGGLDCGAVLTAVVRDFRDSHPDFEYVIEDDRGMVEAQLGADRKPVYAGNPTTPTTNGQPYFDQWYRDDDVNERFEIELALTANGDGTWTYSNSEFFPIDDVGFGNEGRPHNYHFTLELHTEFVYEGGEVFSFTGDDDLFAFIDGTLAIDLGGVHGPQSDTVDLDAVAGSLGLEVGNTYAIDFFFAERHTTQSNFRIDTSIGCFIPGGPVG